MATITLRVARLNKMISIEEAAEKAGIAVEELDYYEKQTGDTPLSIAQHLAALYEWPLHEIYWGSESEFKGCLLDALAPLVESIRKDGCGRCKSEVTVNGVYDFQTNEHSFAVICEACGEVDTFELENM